jgi:D-alanine-D-alanine ligase
MTKAIQILKNKKIGVIMGGWSSEREISLRSGENVHQSLKRQGFNALKIDINRNFAQQIKNTKIDIAFIILHGKPGEDGTIQGFLELLEIPYTGSDVVASAIGMDKIITKRLFESAKIPTPAYVYLPKGCNLLKQIKIAQIKLGFPMILKPKAEGSSVGCEIIDNTKNLLSICQNAQRKFGDIFLEKFINGMIATVGILGQKVLPILELVPKKQRFYDFKAKYTKGETEFIIPARLPKSIYRKIQTLALNAHNVIGAKGFSRVDLIIAKNRPYFLEVNTLPGMTELSDLPAQAKHIGISYDELVLEILKSAIE